ncbi:hypothetical protein GCM10023319_43270 [Nocardia iowensis]
MFDNWHDSLGGAGETVPGRCGRTFDAVRRADTSPRGATTRLKPGPTRVWIRASDFFFDIEPIDIPEPWIWVPVEARSATKWCSTSKWAMPIWSRSNDAAR